MHRYNTEGIGGLKSRKSPGWEPLPTEAQKAELRALVIRVLIPEIHKVVRWRCVDLPRLWSTEVYENTIGVWLGELGLTRLPPRPVYPRKDPAAETTSPVRCGAKLVGTTANKPIEIWFQDEARVGQKATHAYIWAPVGSRPLMVRDNFHDNPYLFGAIRPARGVGAAMITPTANTGMMKVHLAEISTQVSKGAIAVLTCDGAGWHQQGGALAVLDNIFLLHLPPYSPELTRWKISGTTCARTKSALWFGIATSPA